MKDGEELTPTLEKEIKKRIRDQTTPRHVPWKVLTCPDIPHTANGKKVEIAVKRMVDGRTVPNVAALRNPESLDYFANVAKTELAQ